MIACICAKSVRSTGKTLIASVFLNVAFWTFPGCQSLLSCTSLGHINFPSEGKGAVRPTTLRPFFHMNAVKGAPYMRKELPKDIVGGYASWGMTEWDQKIDSVVKAVEHGLNVIYWFSIDLVTDSSTGKATIISRGPPKEVMVQLKQKLQHSGHDRKTVHLISIGGWNAQHPTNQNSAEEVYRAWKEWNEGTMTDRETGFHGFDGIDWDVEGNDDLSSPHNHFTAATLDLMGIFSQLAKKDGYIVSMAPMESYMDPTTSHFSRSATFTNTEWQPIVPSFTYHGRNVYAYILAKYGRTQIQPCDSGSGHGSSAEPQEVDTFDLVTLQLYESYSHANFAMARGGVSPSAFLLDYVRRLRAGWPVRFSSDAALAFPDTTISVSPRQLVIGLANGWAGRNADPPDKFLYVSPSALRPAVEALRAAGEAPRGFAFWSLVHEGDPEPPVCPPAPAPAAGAAAGGEKGGASEWGLEGGVPGERQRLYMAAELRKLLE